MTAKVTVVIPFFQNEQGILRRAVESALHQTHADLQIIVVDDGSPISARTELQDLIDRGEPRLVVIEQANAGPGAARNRGIVNAPADTKYIAFLDSDDTWRPHHIATAVAALERGHDFYFSDFYFPDFKDSTAFARAGKIPVASHRLLDPATGTYAYAGSMLDQILVTGNVIGTSTVVYRLESAPKQRFSTHFYNGQDYVFWLDFFSTTRRAAFSNVVGADYGLGLNIFAGAGWNTSRSLSRLRNELELWRMAKTTYCVDAVQRRAMSNKVDCIRGSVVRDILHRITHRRPIPAKLMLHLLLTDPLVLAYGPAKIAAIVLSKCASRIPSAMRRSITGRGTEGKSAM